MKDNIFVATKQSFCNFLETLSKTYTVVSPYGEENYFFEVFKGKFVFNKYRPVTSLRQFFVPSQQFLGSYFLEKTVKKKPFCIVGVKACDLQSLKIQDYVFLESEIDEEYKNMRDNNIIISSDCIAFKNVCFCVGLDINPYPEELFDLNISLVDDVLLVEVGSLKGKKLIEENQSIFQNARESYLEERTVSRSKLVEEIRRSLKEQGLPSKEILYELVRKGYEKNIWEEEALKCVECGACIMNCPTCHCFLIFDTKEGSYFLRGRIWDGCQYKNFSRVAGGANPLKLRAQRLRNRYIKKFEFFPDRIGIYACTGCGRCIESCIAKIDLREIFRYLYNYNKKSKV